MKVRYWIALVMLIVAAVAVYLAVQSSSDDAEPIVSEAEQQPAPASQAAPYRTLTLDEFENILKNENDQYTIVNVHIPYEGEIEGTDAFIPYNDLDALTAGLPDKNAPIVLYCRSGRMSKIASDALLELGYTQLWDVPGGMVAWEESGRNLKKE